MRLKDKFLDNLRDLAAPPKAISTNVSSIFSTQQLSWLQWSTRGAHINDHVLKFTVHYNDQHPVAYADIQFEARHVSHNDIW